MRRYTTVKSNAYAPISTDILSQNMIHSQLASHYRMMYFASSRVDTSPPWKYKTCNFLSPDRVRRKTKKFAARPSTSIEAYRGELDLQNRSLVDRILYDTNKPPTAYTNECVARRCHVTGEPKRKDVWCTENYINEAPTYKHSCKDKINVPSPNTSLSKQRQVPQFKGANGQTSKKKTCYIKRNSVYGKHISSSSHERSRENIPLSLAKSRIYHSLRSPCEGFQDIRRPFSSGSEGNAGDDEGGTPTSSCDDSNLSLKDRRKHPVLHHKVSSLESVSSHKCVMKKGKGNPCICLASIKEAGNADSRVSSRDSAYEGGEGMSTENQRNSPDECENGSKWFCPCAAVNSIKEGDKLSLHASQADYLFSKSELYMKFLQDVTDDVLVQGVYANEALERIFQDHIDSNEHGLDLDRLKLMIEKLKEDLGIPAKKYTGKQMHNDGPKQKPKISREIFLNAKNDFSIKTRDTESGFNNVMRTQSVSSTIFGNNEKGYSWTKRQILDKQKNLSPFIIIDQNISLTKGEVIDFLSDVGFDDSISEEIFHILAGKCDVTP